jgi:hypothetical protein
LQQLLGHAKTVALGNTAGAFPAKHIRCVERRRADDARGGVDDRRAAALDLDDVVLVGNDTGVPSRRSSQANIPTASVHSC